MIAHPWLWWPNGQGDQPLCGLTVDLVRGGAVVDSWRRKIGIRTIRLVCNDDRQGHSFAFEVNGRPVYCKGANWIPPYQWPGLVTEERYYDLCDRYGIMVWHDFMFSCTL
jgi:beta-mannosidase